MLQTPVQPHTSRYLAVFRFLPLQRYLGLALVTGLLTATHAGAQEPQLPEWLRSLDELMQIEVTSAAKRDQKLADTAAAVFVLTKDDIRRSGFRTVPELLRLVPGVQVAQIDGNKWAVSVRGFNSRWANKLLVMIDGRSIYSRLFSGVFWDTVGVPVSEIERIEVIRGPGGSLWGANAMNGVINIITRTPGRREGAASASLGSFGTSSGSVQYAAPLGGWLAYHAYFDASHQGALQPGTSRDESRNLRAGVGGVATLSRRDEVRVETRALNGESWSLMDQALTSLRPGTKYLPSLNKTVAVSAAAAWTRTLAGGGALDTTVSVEDVQRDEGPIRDVARVLELTFQHTAPRRGRHEATWGLVTQRIEDKVTGTETFHLIPDVARDSVFGAFAQDDVALASNRVTLTLGAKVERLQTTGWHWQPTVRARWNPTAQQTVWAAVSRAVRTPSLVDRGLRLTQLMGTASGLPLIAQISGNPAMPSESLQAHEAGYRWATRRISVDLAAYRNRYKGLGTVERGTPRVESGSNAPYLLYPVMYNNRREASSNGVEALATLTPSSWCRFVSSYTLFTISSRLTPDSNDPSPRFDGNTPRHQGTLRSLFSLPHRLEVDTSVALVGGLGMMNLPPYALADARIGWRSRAGHDLSVVAQNLLDANHLEFQGSGALVVPSVARRRVWAAATWRF